MEIPEGGPKKISARARYRRAFITGLATLLPTILTISLLFFAWGLLDRYVTKPLNGGVKALLSTGPAKDHIVYPIYSLEEVEAPPGVEDPVTKVRRRGARTGYAEAETYTDWLQRKYPWSIGLIFGIILVFFAGFFFTSFLGRKLRQWLERKIHRIPVIKAIYPYAKQVTDFIFKEKEKEKYTQVVAVEYPRKGLYSIAFITGLGFRSISKAAGRKMINVFIPSSPTPITGYTIFVDEEEVIPLPITVDEAIRFAVSGGVLVPAREATERTSVHFKTDRIAGISGRLEGK